MQNEKQTVDERYEQIQQVFKQRVDKDWLLAKCSSEDDILRESVKLCQRLPKPFSDVLAQVETQNDLGKSSWYEVVYHNGEEWCNYAGSDTFSKQCANVLRWVYVKDIFGE